MKILLSKCLGVLKSNKLSMLSTSWGANYEFGWTLTWIFALGSIVTCFLQVYKIFLMTKPIVKWQGKLKYICKCIRYSKFLEGYNLQSGQTNKALGLCHNFDL